MPKLINIFESFFPPADKNGATIRVKAGNGGDNDPGIAGEINAVYGWDTFNNYLGKAGGQKIEEQGDIADFVIQTEAAGSRADYVAVAAGNDAICISWITVTMKDGTKGGAWTGDIGANCKQPNHYSGEKAGTLEDGSDYLPRCTWLDADQTGGNEQTTLKFRVDAYGEKVNDTLANSDVCDMTLWGKAQGPIADGPGKTVNPEKRNAHDRPENIAEELIISDRPKQSAKALCEDDSSWGWDFAGVDGFCDMGTHTFSPYCSKENVPGCSRIDEKNGAKRVLKREIGLKRAVDVTAHDYGKVTHWR